MLPLNAKIKALSKFHLYKAARTFYHVYIQLGSLSGLALGKERKKPLVSL